MWKMIFTALVNIAFAFFGPLGAAALLLGDWLFNAFLVVKVVENVVPNGPAIIGNASEMIPVLFNTLYSAAVPFIMVNYTGMASELMNVTTPAFLDDLIHMKNTTMLV